MAQGNGRDSAETTEARSSKNPGQHEPTNPGRARGRAREARVEQSMLWVTSLDGGRDVWAVALLEAPGQ